ncbi:complex I subunit 4 family protein [Pampinifervens florentissimum]|uniref:complex I subunit 4 family protein n=1 Tax=Pampinifervens florentissimum TaxID=1632019 RepID=UPI0013B4818B|nr:NuoM family protein [Hydrogenobacter sp. T-8]QID32572.1 NuoM family protein [Hydrogenobacter sp. T-8]
MENLLSLAIFLPLLGSLLVAIVRKEKFSKFLSLGISSVVFLIVLYLFLNFDWSAQGFQYRTKVDWIPSLGISYHVGVDGMAISLLLMTSLVFVVAFLWSLKVEDRPNLYFALFLALETACLGVFSALDFFLFYLFWEGMLIPMYFIIGLWGHDRKVYAANKFFVYTFFGSIFLLLGLASIVVYGYIMTGKLSFDYLFHLSFSYPMILQTAAFLLFGLGFAVKIPMWPVHTWLPDAHVEAPTAGSVVLAAVLLKMGTFGFVRYSLPLFPDASKYFIPLIFFLSVVAIIYTAMMAIAQTHIKRLIAYSSISHMGVVTLGTFAMDLNALNGAIYMMVAHGLSSAALFMSAGFIYDRVHSYHMDDLGGLARYVPKLAVLFMISGLAGIGFPGLAGFVAEFLVFLGTYKNFPVWSFIAGVGVVLSAAYFLYMYKRVMFEEETISEYRLEKWRHLKDLEAHHILSFILIIASAFLLGLYPYPFIKVIEQTSRYVLGG